MREYGNLKYAVRAGSDIMLAGVAISMVGPVEDRGQTKMRRLEVTDGHVTLPLVVFGDAARQSYQTGRRIRAGPVYWSGQWENFSLTKGGTVAVS